MSRHHRIAATLTTLAGATILSLTATGTASAQNAIWGFDAVEATDMDDGGIGILGADGTSSKGGVLDLIGEGVLNADGAFSLDVTADVENVLVVDLSD